MGFMRPRTLFMGYYTNYVEIERKRIAEAESKAARAKQRGECFVGLFAAAKQLTDNFPKRFPYLQHQVDQIEQLNLAPKLEDSQYASHKVTKT